MVIMFEFEDLAPDIDSICKRFSLPCEFEPFQLFRLQPILTFLVNWVEQILEKFLRKFNPSLNVFEQPAYQKRFSRAKCASN